MAGDGGDHGQGLPQECAIARQERTDVVAVAGASPFRNPT